MGERGGGGWRIGDDFLADFHFADDGSGVIVAAVKSDQRLADMRHVVLVAVQLQYLARVRRGNVDDGLGGLD